MIDDLLSGWAELQSAAPGYEEAESSSAYAEAESSGVEEKTCTVCSRSLPIDQFYPRTAQCKSCQAEKQRRYLATPEGRTKRREWERNRARAMGLAEHHMVRPGDTSRPCTECGEVKDFSEFYKTRTGNPAAKCKVCVRAKGRQRYDARSPEEKDQIRLRNLQYRQDNPERVAAWRREWVEKDPERAAFVKTDSYYFSRYRLRLADIEAMLASQDGKCAACACTLEKFHVDHDHACCSGDKSCGSCVRGLLCAGCNTALGYVRDDVDRLMGLAAYLMQSRSVLNFDGSDK